MMSKAPRTAAPAPRSPAAKSKPQNPRSVPINNPNWQRFAMWSLLGAEAPPAERLPILPRLKVNDAEDPLEHAADRMADTVLRKPIQDAAPSSGDDGPRPEPPRSSAAAAAPNELFGSSGRPLEEPVRTDLAARFGHDFSCVRVHTDPTAAEAARNYDALAFSVGQDIAFSAGAYAPHTTAGKSLLAHELAHTVQARQGLAEGRLQRRRVPSSVHLGSALPPAADTVGLGRARTGLARVLSRAWRKLSSTKRGRVTTQAAAFGITYTDEASLLTALDAATRAQLTQFADAIRAVAPGRELGDPALIDTGPRPLTRDAVHITTVVGHANALFATIASGSHDSHLGQVFGSANVAAAKAKYANAKSRMDTLHTTNMIVTDRSGYSDEVSLGGLSNASQIAVHFSVIDQPTSRESRVTLLHESMHAGNSDVDDHGYIEQPSFTVLDEPTKLANAAHYEVVPRRILGMHHAFRGVTFTPAGTGGTPSLSPRQKAIRNASEAYRSAWTAGLNLHTLIVRLFRNPSEWSTLDLPTKFTGAPAGSLFSTTLPFWSKVEMLTIHERLPTINPAGADAVRPVTIIDVALSEGLVRKLAQGMNLVPATEAAAGAFETAHATAAEIAAATTVAAERDLLIRLVIRAHLRSITGDETRDARVVARLAQLGAVSDFSDMFVVRPPSAFP